MLLTPDDAELFFKLHRSLMFFVNNKLGIVSRRVRDPKEFSLLPAEIRLQVRTAFGRRFDLIDDFVAENPWRFNDDELAILESWKHQIQGTFFLLRQLLSYAIFLQSDDPPIAYGVRALTEVFEDLVRRRLPVMVETVLLPFKDSIVYDGLLSTYNISFGSGIRRGLNESYRKAKQTFGVVTTLPFPAIKPASRKRSKQPLVRKRGT